VCLHESISLLVTEAKRIRLSARRDTSISGVADSVATMWENKCEAGYFSIVQ
jgi:hypothetical protein